MIDDGSVQPLVFDLAIVGGAASQLLTQHRRRHGQIHHDFVEALEAGQRCGPGEESVDGRCSVHEAVVDRC